MASKTHRTRDVDDFRRALGIDDEVNVGSVGLKVAMVADARRDLYVYPGSRTKLWDTCGPEAVLIAAGGRLTDVHGQPLDYTRPDLQNRTRHRRQQRPPARPGDHRPWPRWWPGARLPG